MRAGVPDRHGTSRGELDRHAARDDPEQPGQGWPHHSLAWVLGRAADDEQGIEMRCGELLRQPMRRPGAIDVDVVAVHVDDRGRGRRIVAVRHPDPNRAAVGRESPGLPRRGELVRSRRPLGSNRRFELALRRIALDVRRRIRGRRRVNQRERTDQSEASHLDLPTLDGRDRPVFTVPRAGARSRTSPAPRSRRVAPA